MTELGPKNRCPSVLNRRFLKRTLRTALGKRRGDRMASRPRGIVSRRAALVGFAATAVASVSASAEPAPGDATAENAAGPVFSPSGPNAELYGAAEGFPIA